MGSQLQGIFSQFSAFGFSGSRTVPSLGGLSRAAACVPSGASVFVGCARGVDEYFRMAFPSATVFSVESGQFGSGPSAFARRSVACVSAVVAAGGLWVSFPSSVCPPGLSPSSRSSTCFCGSGSGSWASLAFALGSGCACLVFLGSLPCPSGWGLSRVPCWSGWFFCPAAPAQVSLF
jgi:hypothetical protein